MTKILVSLFFLWFTSQSDAQTEKVEKDVFVLLEQYAKALNEKDAQKASSYMSSDPFFKYISSGFVVKKEEWVKLRSESWERMSDYSFRWTDKKINVLSATSAVATCKSSYTYRIKGGPWGSGTSVFTLTFEKVDEHWYITSIHESATISAN